ncbi:MAG: hypothetical protein U9N82_07755 [Thermodesulfobacteriota bacterium]|nr:hypothetical protein [Thermodesulfobacteriota bacterium]
MSNNKKKKIPEIPINETLPTVFVDNLMISTRSDGLNYLCFSTALPGGLKEEARMMVPMENLKRMIDVLCKQCDYFPAKPKPKGKSSRKTS